MKAEPKYVYVCPNCKRTFKGNSKLDLVHWCKEKRYETTTR